MNTNLNQEQSKLKIGSVELDSPVFLAPMAGITDMVFRQMIRLFSKKCLLVSEMVSSEALKMNKENHIIDHCKTEYPLAFQLCGHKPYLMAEGAKKLESISTLIDINMGCPAPKIVKNGDGSALMQDLKLVSQIISAVKNAVNIPVTVKTRVGWDCNSKNYVEFAKMAEESGADAIIIHGRTRSQQYSGLANWQHIAEAKENVNIPVVGNGDITSPEIALNNLKTYNLDGVSIGRGTLGDPGLIYRIEHALETGEILPEPTIQERLDLAMLHLKKEIEYRGEEHGIRFMRKFFAWYIRGIRGASQFRYQAVRLEKFDEIQKMFDEIKELANLC